MQDKMGLNFSDKIDSIEWYISHKTWKFKLWKTIVLFSQIISVFLYGYYASHKHHFGKIGLGIDEMFWEIIFFLDMIVNFFVSYYEYNPTGGQYLEKDPAKIANHYYKTELKSDLIALIPIQ